MNKSNPLFLILFLSLVSLFADITYEGARSIIGPYLESLGANAIFIGFVAGLGELIGYSFRLVSGYFTDRFKKYWGIAIFGYIINLLSVPLLALVKNLSQAFLLISTERLGKAIRTPAKDTILSFASFQIGRGKSFGFHETMDQIGALIGPLFVSFILIKTNSYKYVFLFLGIPALIALLILFFTYSLYPQPHKFEHLSPRLKFEKFSKKFWLYIIAIGCYGAGYADFALISYHLIKNHVFSLSLIPIAYTLAMGIDGIFALFLGFLFDKLGLYIIVLVIAISSLFSPLIFLGNYILVFLGLILWGIGLGAQESIIKAALPLFISKEKRATGYGFFYLIYGIFWFVGSFLLGIFYEISLFTLISFSLFLHFLSVALILKLKNL